MTSSLPRVERNGWARWFLGAFLSIILLGGSAATGWVVRRVDSVEVRQTTIRERLATVESDLRYIRQSLERIEQKLNHLND